ncbi:M15 family metallopeptidase [Arthrobacter koreensis]|uniref:M15 family metallopeptidase n=1 Tax=Arthrobacter koreensis TaxID=199136 RepID=UPI003D8A3B6D
MALTLELATRKRRSQRIRNAAVLALFAALISAYLLTFGAPQGLTARLGALPPGQHVTLGPLGAPADDGDVGDGVSAFDEGHAAVTNLDPALLGALRTAAVDASAAGVGIVVTSGWRSPEYQQRLLQDAVTQYGSEAEAARWVATAETSAHVRGDAVDVGPYAAIDWLTINGAGYGLCQVYANEPWHFEYLPDAAASGCPAMYPDPTWDPRLNPA